MSLRIKSQPRLKSFSAEARLEADALKSKVDIVKALKLPTLVKTGQFTFRTNVLANSSTTRRRLVKSAETKVNIEPLDDFQKYLLDHKQIKRTKEEIQDKILITQHKDIWIANIKKLKNGSGAINSEIELLLATLFKDIASTDNAKLIFEELLSSIQHSNNYHSNLR